jgi:hypothetical protein
MTIFALFLCMHYPPGPQICELSPTPAPVRAFSNLSDCQAWARRLSGVTGTPKDGRFVMPWSKGDNIDWAECRSRHVEIWQPAQ